MYSLPSLRELYSTNLEQVTDSIRSMIGSTLTFTDRGHGLFMCSPTEIQKLSISADVKYVEIGLRSARLLNIIVFLRFREQINEMLCELYSPSISMPEAPKQNFFAKLFASNAMIDPDQLCKISFRYSHPLGPPYFLVGEAAGKAPAGVIKREDVNVNMDQLRGRTNTANNAIHDTRMVGYRCGRSELILLIRN